MTVSRAERVALVRAEMDGLERMVLGDYRHILLLPEVANMDSAVRFMEAIKEVKECMARFHLAAYKIQQWWLFVTSSPEYAVGRRRIEAGYDAEFGEREKKCL
jgi:hypothetical protein